MKGFTKDLPIVKLVNYIKQSVYTNTSMGWNRFNTALSCGGHDDIFLFMACFTLLCPPCAVAMLIFSV